MANERDTVCVENWEKGSSSVVSRRTIKMHETTTFLFVTLSNIHRLKNVFTDLAINLA